MSGRAKRICFHIFEGACYLLAALAMILVTLFTVEKERPGVGELIAAIALLLSLFINLPVLLHELGHLCFGLLCGMRLVSIRIKHSQGMISMIPKGEHTRGKLCFYALGGIVFNFLFGITFYLLYFLLPYHAALLYLELVAPFILIEGLRALFPIELEDGKTDGAVFLGLLKKKSEEEIFLRVERAQGILLKNSFSALERDLLWKVPVVREDLPAYLSLLFLRAQELFSREKFDEAKKVLFNLRSIEGLDEEKAGEVERYLLFFEGKFERKKQLLFGVNELEEKLFAVQKKII